MLAQCDLDERQQALLHSTIDFSELTAMQECQWTQIPKQHDIFQSDEQQMEFIFVCNSCVQREV